MGTLNLTVDDATLDYSEAGTGPAILLIHGFPLDRTIWSAQIAALSKSARVIAPDLRGHGLSAAAPGPLSMERHARDLLALMDHLKIKKFAAAGHSMGGYVLLALHKIAKSRLSALALVATRAGADPPEARKNREESAKRVEKEGVGFIADSMAGRLLGAENPPLSSSLKALMAKTPATGVAGALRGMASRPDATPELSRITVPTVVIAGRLDRIVPTTESESMARSIAGSRMVRADRSGHMPMMEEPALVTEALARLVGGR